MDTPILWYVADPMCSWCWGFSPVIEAIKAEYAPQLKIALLLGGLRSESTPMTPAQRADILHHWQEVHALTGQSFHFEGALPEGFVYDTEPACRAVVTMGKLAPDMTFPLLKAIHAAFYAEGRNVVFAEVLAELAAGLGIDAARFLAAFESDDAKARTLAHFRQAREWGVRGFPTLIQQDDAGYRMLANGWHPLEDLRPDISAWLASA
jgi:putative protein-disulfide isomerase